MLSNGNGCMRSWMINGRYDAERNIVYGEVAPGVNLEPAFERCHD